MPPVAVLHVPVLDRSVQSIGLVVLPEHLLYSTPNALWESILRIKLHLQSTIHPRWSLVQFPASADSRFRRSSRTITRFASVLVDLLGQPFLVLMLDKHFKSLLLTSH